MHLPVSWYSCVFAELKTANNHCLRIPGSTTLPCSRRSLPCLVAFWLLWGQNSTSRDIVGITRYQILSLLPTHLRWPSDITLSTEPEKVLFLKIISLVSEDWPACVYVQGRHFRECALFPPSHHDIRHTTCTMTEKSHNSIELRVSGSTDDPETCVTKEE